MFVQCNVESTTSQNCYTDGCYAATSNCSNKFQAINLHTTNNAHSLDAVKTFNAQVMVTFCGTHTAVLTNAI